MTWLLLPYFTRGGRKYIVQQSAEQTDVVRGGAATRLQPGYEKEKRLRLPDVFVSSDKYMITADCE